MIIKFTLSLVAVLISTIIITSCNGSKTDYKTKSINPDISKEASYLLDFLYEIGGKKTLTGHHHYRNNPIEFQKPIKEMTGKYPVVWGADFSFGFENQYEVDSKRQTIIDTAKSLYNKGHIITLMWHQCFPSKGDTCSGKTIWLWDKTIADKEWSDLTTEGSELNALWKQRMDNVAGYLKQLNDAGIPVLWRPFHEMNGIWFWWCNHPGEDGTIKLWKYMYHYFTDVHKLNNLIWVWNANAPRDIKGDEAYPYKDYFPGLDFVDVLAADVYHNDYRKSHHDQLLELGKGKPIALGEVGKMPTPKILNEQPMWSWFMGWANWLYKENDPDSVKALYNDTRTISMDKLMRNKESKFSIKE
ncbi:MAG: glycosyl hydrolase family 26 [Melioribacteraceae bacterium]|nr:glycosyl hydrolase family 26 [Melioribacteraceae bacterium]